MFNTICGHKCTLSTDLVYQCRYSLKGVIWPVAADVLVRLVPV